MWNLKYDINELICETGSQAQRIRLVVSKREGFRRVMDKELGLIDENIMYRINNKVYCMAQDYSQYPVINDNGKEYEKEYIYIYTHVYIIESLFCKAGINTTL